MNTSQITNIVTTLIGLVCGYFVAEGKMDNSTETQIIAGAGALVTFIVSQIIHGAANANSPKITGGGSAPLLALGIFAITFAGCASAPENAYKAEAAADITVSAAMTAWGDYVAQNHPPTATEQAVENAFEKYQAAELLAIDSTVAATATNSAANNSNMTAAATAATNALNDLESLLKSFGVTF